MQLNKQTNKQTNNKYLKKRNIENLPLFYQKVGRHCLRDPESGIFLTKETFISGTQEPSRSALFTLAPVVPGQ